MHEYAKYRRIPRTSPWAYLFHKDISVGFYKNMGLFRQYSDADTKIVLLKSIKGSEKYIAENHSASKNKR